MLVVEISDLGVGLDELSGVHGVVQRHVVSLFVEEEELEVASHQSV